jgi:hypothetical protein
MPLRSPDEAEAVLTWLESEIGLAIDATATSERGAVQRGVAQRELRRAGRAASKLSAELEALGPGARRLAMVGAWHAELARVAATLPTNGHSQLVGESEAPRLYQEAAARTGELAIARTLASLERLASWLADAAKAAEPSRARGRPGNLRSMVLARVAFEAWTKFTDAPMTRSRETTTSPWEEFVAAVFHVAGASSKGSDRYARLCVESSRTK